MAFRATSMREREGVKCRLEATLPGSVGFLAMCHNLSLRRGFSQNEGGAEKETPSKRQIRLIKVLSYKAIWRSWACIWPSLSPGVLCILVELLQTYIM